MEVATLSYPSGRTADEVVVRDEAALAWVVNLGCVDLNPHPVLAGDLDHPDELRIDLDPVPGVEWAQVVEVALVVREVLDGFGLTGWPKTSGSRGFHVYARIRPEWTFAQVRLAAEAVAREVERRAPGVATSRWWKEERSGVFVDYNQNARDHTVASAYSVRPTPDARVSTPLSWREVRECDPGEFTIDTVPGRFREIGDPWAGIGESVGSLAALLEFAESLPPAPTVEKGTIPVIEIARARHKDEAMAGLERWKARHPGVAARLRPADVLVDSMRGSSSTWTRIRVNLSHVPEAERPPQEPLEVDYDPWAALRDREPGADPRQGRAGRGDAR
ncbi:DNA polymerase domain-containing protein [Thermocatellispora tengchongensis]|uniref:DNA polymerase domain-containing protein n=1 Tax=Thermocatellispora tengchongensis TaxID=1073253 RepID=UPI0036364A55